MKSTLAARGRLPTFDRLPPVVPPAAKLLKDGDVAAMVAHYQGLLWGDVYVWLLLGIEKAPGPKEMERRAAEAPDLFLAMFKR